MKKFVFSAVIIAVFALTACQTTKFGLVYNVSITGDGDGKFKVEFPQGSYAMNGKADLELKLGDSIPFNQVTPKSEVLAKNNKKEVAVLSAVNDSIAEKFNVIEGSGTYDILIQGTVKEIGTGLAFSVNKRITNRPVNYQNNIQKYVEDTTKSSEPYMYVR